MSKTSYKVLKPIFAYGQQWRAGETVALDEDLAKEVGMDRLQIVADEAAQPEAPVAAPEAPSDTTPPQEPAPEAPAAPAEEPAAPDQPEAPVAPGKEEDLSDL